MRGPANIDASQEPKSHDKEISTAVATSHESTPFSAGDLIHKVRERLPLGQDGIEWLIRSFLDGSVADFQMSAWLMAVVFRGLSRQDTLALTRAMASSGRQMDWQDMPVVDKHSTGGVGDKVSLVTVPLVAAAGLRVPKLSGRGLGFTGGTLDKLEAIPGLRTSLSADEMRRQVLDVGCAIVAATPDLVPADKRLYALRDATDTVDSLPLIASSIMSKKLAGGARAIVLDVKCGRGAMMQTEQDARRLAQLMIDIGAGAGRRVVAILSRMDEPIGLSIGNALETREAIQVLRGTGSADTRELSLTLAAWMLVAGGVTEEYSEAREIAVSGLSNGSAAARFRRMVVAQGGDAKYVDDPDLLIGAPFRSEVQAEREGFVVGVDARRLGILSMGLGAGRDKPEDRVDPAVGILLHRKSGDRLRTGDVLAEVHARSPADARRAIEWVRSCYQIGGTAVEPPPLIIDVLRGGWSSS